MACESLTEREREKEKREERREKREREKTLEARRERESKRHRFSLFPSDFLLSFHRFPPVHSTADAWTRDFERAEQLATDVANAIQVRERARECVVRQTKERAGRVLGNKNKKSKPKTIIF